MTASRMPDQPQFSENRWGRTLMADEAPGQGHPVNYWERFLFETDSEAETSIGLFVRLSMGCLTSIRRRFPAEKVEQQANG